MSLNSQYSTTARDAALDALAALCNSGYLRIYSGAQPATGDTAITSQVQLAELRFSATAFAASAAGVATANSITSDSAADATGTASWFRAYKSDGTTAVYDGSVGTASSNLVLNTTAIQINGTVSVTALTITMPAAGS